MRKISILSALILVALLGVSNLFATCAPGSVIWGQAANYLVTTPGAGTVGTTLFVDVYELTKGATVHDGTRPDTSMIFPYGGGYYLYDDWFASEYIGCIADTSGPQVCKIDDVAGDDSDAYFAAGVVSVDKADPNAFWYDYDDLGATFALTSLPQPLVDSWDRGTGAVTFHWGAPGFYTDGNTALASVITGYDLYSFETSGATPTDPGRNPASWTYVETISGGGTSSRSTTITVPASGNCTYLALRVNLDSGFQSDYISVPSGCLAGANLAGGFESVAVTLISKKTFQIDWVTNGEYNTVGFNVLRSESPAGPFAKVNGSVIPATGIGGAGASYFYIDELQAPKGTFTYFYQIEMVGGSDVSNVYSMISSASMHPKGK